MTEMNRRRGTTLVLVTHENELAARADRRIVLRDGQIVADEILHDASNADRLDVSKAERRDGVDERRSNDSAANERETDDGATAEELEASKP